ncbi:MAG: pilus assembly protein PilP [Polyangiaceae bacterium]|nr:pilus assembly protein PilP [Polyangiaceae bacterium]MCE7890453.1 pilus assembly protein PilP [Sorangiineae bacterium PRO1]MCL4753256.1 pilus assembly protein PilP [Myxococcales bacterium]
MTRAVLAFIALAGLVAACSSKGPTQGAPAGSSAPVVVALPDAGLGDAPSGPPKIDFQEAEFAENEKSRDPFRSFSTMFVEEARGKVKSQREVLLDQYAVDELKLVGIVTGIDPAKAMLVDPTGKGHVVQRGQFVGRAEVVQASTTTARSYEINWRVDRIRDGDVVLIREDPQNPDVPSATKVIPLRPEGSVVSEK